MAEYRQPHLVKLRAVNPAQHWEPRVGIGHEEAVHDGDDCIWVPKGPHAEALLRSGYIIVSE
jgi:hypothetical protein